MPTYESSEITIAYDDVGHGSPLVLVHGHPFNRSMWRPQADHFSRRGWRVIAPDLRGYGQSSIIPGTTPLTTFARDIATLLDHLEIGRAVIGGLSMGGQIVMEFARLFPERLRALILADTTAEAETEEGKRERRATADRLLEEGMDPYARDVLPKMLARYNVDALPDVADAVFKMMQTTPPEGAAAALRGRAERRDFTRDLAKIDVPALVVVGRDDEFTPVSAAERIDATLPCARLAVIDGAGHMPNLERPAEFNDALGALLDSLPNSDRGAPRARIAE